MWNRGRQEGHSLSRISDWLKGMKWMMSCVTGSFHMGALFPN